MLQPFSTREPADERQYQIRLLPRDSWDHSAPAPSDPHFQERLFLSWKWDTASTFRVVAMILLHVSQWSASGPSNSFEVYYDYVHHIKENIFSLYNSISAFMGRLLTKDSANSLRPAERLLRGIHHLHRTTQWDENGSKRCSIHVCHS